MRSRDVGGHALAAIAAAGVAVVTALGCGLALEGLGPDVAGDDGGPGDDGGGVEADVAVEGDAPPVDDGPEPETDAPPVGDGGFSTVTLASVGAISSATGLAQQTHLVWASHSARWWLFWLDPAQPLQLQASWSSDFVSWTLAGPLVLPLPHGNEAANFSVAYADLGGVDVVHFALGGHDTATGNRVHGHVRATIVGASITYGSVSPLSSVSDPTFADPDGPATIVAADGTVWDASGWAGTAPGGETVWASAAPDVGGAWSGSFLVQEVLASTPNPVNARTFATATGGPLLALWELGDQQPNPTRLGWTQYVSGTVWIPSNVVFNASTQSANDWDAVPVGPNDVRLVRRRIDGAFEHASFTGSWGSFDAPPADPGLAGSGIVLLTDGKRVGLVAIGSDAAASVRMVVWDGAAWGAWKTLEGTTAGRGFLSGWSSPGHAAVIWTEVAGSSFAIVGRPVALQ